MEPKPPQEDLSQLPHIDMVKVGGEYYTPKDAKSLKRETLPTTVVENKLKKTLAKYGKLKNFEVTPDGDSIRIKGEILTKAGPFLPALYPIEVILENEDSKIVVENKNYVQYFIDPIQKSLDELKNEIGDTNQREVRKIEIKNGELVVSFNMNRPIAPILKTKKEKPAAQATTQEKIDSRPVTMDDFFPPKPVAPAITDDDAAGFAKMFKAPIIPVEPKIEQTVTPPEPEIPIITEEPIAPIETEEVKAGTDATEEEIPVENENKENIRESKIIDGKGKESLFDSMEEFTLETGDTVVAGSDKGIDYKDHNEDRAVVCPKESLIMVIDGVGGSSNGERAAQILAEATLKNPQKKVDDIVLDTVEEMRKQAVGNSSAVFISARISVENGRKFVDISQIGDAKLIIIDKYGGMVFETQDENMLSKFVESGNVDPDQALYMSQPAHLITPNQLSLEKTDPFTGKKLPKTIEDMKTVTQVVDLKEGDLVLLYSDGIGNNFTSREIAAVKKENDFTPTQLFKWISDKTTERMKNKEKILGTTDEEKEKVLKDRAEKGYFSDGFKSAPKKDNRSLAIIEIKDDTQTTTSPEGTEAIVEDFSDADIASLSDEELDALVAEYEEGGEKTAEPEKVVKEMETDEDIFTHNLKMMKHDMRLLASEESVGGNADYVKIGEVDYPCVGLNGFADKDTGKILAFGNIQDIQQEIKDSGAIEFAFKKTMSHFNLAIRENFPHLADANMIVQFLGEKNFSERGKENIQRAISEYNKEHWDKKIESQRKREDRSSDPTTSKKGKEAISDLDKRQQKIPIVIPVEAKPAQPVVPDLNKRINIPIPVPKPPETKKPEDDTDDDVINRVRRRRFY